MRAAVRASLPHRRESGASVAGRARALRRAARALGCVAFAAVLAASLGADVPLRFEAPRWTRAQMEAQSGDAPWTFVYGTRDAALSPALRERALGIARRAFGADSTRVRADTDVSAAQFAAGSVVLLGGPAENAWTERLAARLPLVFGARRFTWRGKEYARPGDAIALTYPNPLASRRFLMLIVANSTDAYVRRGPFWMGGEDWRIVRDGEVARSGSFAQGASAPWHYDAARDRDREQERERFAGTLRTTGRTLRVRAAPGVDAEPVRAAGEGLLARMDAVGLAAPAGARGAPPTLTFYASLEQKGLLTRDTRPEHVDGAAAHVGGRASSGAGSTRETPDLWCVAALRLAQRGASADSRFFEPASVWLAGRIDGEPLAVAVSRLYFGRVLPTAAQAATRAGTWRSPLVWTPARSLLARAAWESAAPARRPATLAALLAADPPGTLDSLCRRAGLGAVDVARRYQRLADSLARAGQRARQMRRPATWRPAEGFQRGVCLAHAVSLERGYVSASCANELAYLKGIGANALSLTPFAYLPDTHTPVLYPSTDGPDEETDESIGEAAARAHALGLKVWLKPHLWTRGWIGELDFSPGDWPRFFERYREWMLHQALLADRERLDGLFVGHELVSSTRLAPERWRALITDVRRVYGGVLSYGANWDEVQQVPFWDALDYIGVSFYNPLAAAPTTDVAVLRAGVRKALAPLRDLSARYGRPVLLAEVGYAPVATAPVRPWEEGGAALDLEAQRACYDALVSELNGADWVAGVYWWKWFSSPTVGGPQDASFTPRGKPAEAVVKAAMRLWARRVVKARAGG